MNIAVTGFYGTGSSAVIDLLREYDGVDCAIGERYEHYPFLLKDCLFDLENAIFSPNSNYLIIDKAISNFIDEMNRQNNYDFGWYGSYKKLTGSKFLNLVNEFIDKISFSKPDSKNFVQSQGIKFSLFKCFLQLGASILKGYKIKKLGRVYVYKNKPRRYLKVSHEEFMIYAKEFITGYFNLFRTNDIMVYDHLLLPEQLELTDKFFDKNFKLIVVDRDPRDVYISSKYIWSSVKWGMQKSPFVNTIEGFENFWLNSHERLVNNKSKNVLIVKFEDLIYNYEDTVKVIEDFCGLNSKDHTKIKSFLNPNKSIKNTQVYKLNDKYLKEALLLEAKLKNYFFSFPYDINSTENDVFDA